MTDTKHYDESNFDVLEGLEPVRQVPGMYTRTKNPLHILQEVLDNAFDEAQNKFATEVGLIMHTDGSVSVSDNGRGIPVGLHPTQKIPVVVLAFTRLHAGAKFRKGDSYQRSGGLHGVGVAVTNALSTTLSVEVRRDGECHRFEFEDGDRGIKPLGKIGDAPAGVSGTTVRFSPNPRYFDSPNIPVNELLTILRSKAMLLPGVTVRYLNENTRASQEWRYEDGIREYLSERTRDMVLLGDMFTQSAFVPENMGDGIVAGDGADWAIQWSETSGKGESYVNLIGTPLGGTHEAGLRQGIFEAMRQFCEHHTLLPRGITLQAEDVWGHANYVLSAHIVNTQFQGQTKDKLTSREAVRLLSSVVKDPCLQWLMSNPDSSKKIAELVIAQATARQRQGKTVERRKTSSVATLPGKLTDCQSTDITRNELFLVEGDSAGGGCKGGRDRTYQAILPLRGKVLNTWEVQQSLLFSNREVQDISIALGVLPHEADAPDSVLAELRYGKVVILSDADVDGLHIQILLLTLFFKHFPKLIEKGHVFIAKPPLFRVDAPGRGKSKAPQKIYCLTDAERDDTVAQLKRDGFKQEQLTISRFKGLGEMNEAQLKDTVLHPDTRLMLQVHVDDARVAAEVLNDLMAKGNADVRRAKLEEFGNNVEVDI